MKQLDQLLRVLDYIAKHNGVTVDTLKDELGISERTARRIIASGRRYGVVMTFTRYIGGGGEWSIESWGIFDSRAVKKHLR